MWNFVINALIYIAAVFIQKALSPKPDAPQPAGAGNFEAPTTDSARAIPVVFGTCKVTGPNVAWFGQTSATPYYRDNGAGGSYLAGYNYGAVMDLALCHGPVDQVLTLLIDDHDVGWTNDGDDPTHGLSYFSADNPNLFGGENGGGGFRGGMLAYWGTMTQQIDPYMQMYCSPDYPGLAGLCHVVFLTSWGHSPYLRPVSVVVLRCPNGLGLTSNMHKVATTVGSKTVQDANPACMLYEILTDTTWGLGIDPSQVDLTSFRAVGASLFTEGFGLSMQFEQAGAATDLIREILRHVDGGLTTDPATGKLMLKLIRADYTIGSLPVLDESCIDEVEYSRNSWGETVNTARITFTSWADNFTDRVAQWQNLANQQVVGVTTLAQIAYKGCSNAHTAGIVAARVLKLGSYPFAKLRFKANRKAWALRQCDVFVLNWPALGIANMVCRVTKPAGGQLEDGMMTLECIEDAFAIANTAFSETGASGWANPSANPAPVTLQRLWESPAQLSFFAGGGYVSRDPWVLAARSASNLTGFQVWSDPAGGTAYTKTGEASVFTPYGTLQSAYAENTAYLDTTGFVVGNLIDAADVDAARELVFSNVTFKGLVLIDNEVMGYTGISGTGATRTLTGVWRGLFDTVPAAHAASAPVWFILNNKQRCQVKSAGYSSDVTITAKLLTTTPSAVELLAAATQVSLTLTNRQARYIPPGNVKINGTSWPTSLAHTVDAVVTWAYRDLSYFLWATSSPVASQDTVQLFENSGGFNGHFQIEVRVAGVLKRTVSALDAKTWTWTQAMQTTDCSGVYNKTVSIRIIPLRNTDDLPGTYQERTYTVT